MIEEPQTSAPHYGVSFEKLKENMPPLRQQSKDPADAIYGRLLTYPETGTPLIESYQYILFWKMQKLPRHEFDYAPLFLFKMMGGQRTLGTPKGGLKTIAPFFGYEWSDSEMDGVQAGMLYSRYLRSGEEPNWINLLQYNRDDVMATFWLLELQEISL